MKGSSGNHQSGSTTTRENIGKGQVLRQDYGRDNSSHGLKDTQMDQKFGGGPNYLGHSLPGVTAKQSRHGGE